MALESRSRMISFRLTDDEYDRFRRLCIARGLRNVSELVRAAVNQLMEDPRAEQANHEVTTRLNTLEARLSELARAVNQVEARLPKTVTTHHHDGSQFTQTASPGSA